MNASRRKTLVTLAFAVIILVPSMIGFVTKFWEFVQTFRGESGGVFAITPMVNYLLASLGFLCMLTWAILNGMFRDLEQPKETMLEQERLLDSRSRLPGGRSRLPGGT
jgi:hypothetical protein